jgi:hypothetical protein
VDTRPRYVPEVKKPLEFDVRDHDLGEPEDLPSNYNCALQLQVLGRLQGQPLTFDQLDVLRRHATD